MIHFPWKSFGVPLEINCQRICQIFHTNPKLWFPLLVCFHSQIICVPRKWLNKMHQPTIRRKAALHTYRTSWRFCIVLLPALWPSYPASFPERQHGKSQINNLCVISLLAGTSWKHFCIFNSDNWWIRLRTVYTDWQWLSSLDWGLFQPYLEMPGIETGNFPWSSFRQVISSHGGDLKGLWTSRTLQKTSIASPTLLR